MFRAKTLQHSLQGQLFAITYIVIDLLIDDRSMLQVEARPSRSNTLSQSALRG